MYSNISNDAKDALKADAVITTARITLTSNNQVIDGDNLCSVKITDQCSENGVIVGTAMCKEVEIELIDDNYDLADKEFSLEVGVLLPNDTYEYIPYGNFIVKEYKKVISSGHYNIIAYDYMDKLNADFIDNNKYYNGITLQQFYESVANQYNIQIETQNNLPNKDFLITKKPYFENMSGRVVISRIAELMGCFAKINRSNKLEMKLTNTTNEQITRNEMNTSLEVNDMFGPVNVVTLRLTDIEGENVTKRDEESILEYGEHPLQIYDNPFVDTEALRLLAIDELYDQLDGFSYYPTTFNSKLIYLDCGDVIEVQDMETDNFYSTIILKQTIEIPTTRACKFENTALTETALKYQYTSEQVRKNKRTEYIVDKENQKITELVETVEEISGDVSNLYYITDDKEGKNIFMDDASNQALIDLKLHGKTYQEERNGKNLFNKLDVKSATNISSYNYSIITGNYTIVQSSSGTCALSFNIDLPAGTYTYSGNIGLTTVEILNSSDTVIASIPYDSTTFTINDTATYIRYTWAESLANTKSFYVDSIQIEKGSTVTSYEEYGVAPSLTYPSEIINGCGKNLLNLNNCTFENCTFIRDENKVKASNSTSDENYYCSIKTTSLNSLLTVNIGKIFTFSVAETIQNKTMGVIIHGYNKDNQYTSVISPSAYSVNTFTFEVPNYFQRVTELELLLNKNNSAFTDNTTFFSNIQLEKGGEATKYVPWGIIQIKETSKNMLDYISNFNQSDKGISFTLNDDGTITASGTATEDFAKAIPDTDITSLLNDGETYTLSMSNIQNKFYCLIEASRKTNTGGSVSQYYNSYNTPTFTVNFSEYTKYELRIRTTSASSWNDEPNRTVTSSFQLEQNLSATNFEKYNSKTYDFPLNYIRLLEGSYLAEDGIHDTRGQLQLNGKVAMYYDSVFKYIIISLDDLDMNIGSTLLLCDYFKSYSASDFIHNDTLEGIAFDNDDYEKAKNILIRINSLNSSGNRVSEYKLWLNTYKPIVEYELNYEKVTEYNQQQKAAWFYMMNLITNKPITHIHSDNNLTLTYARYNGLDIYDTIYHTNRIYAIQELTNESILDKVSQVETLMTENDEEIGTIVEKTTSMEQKSDKIDIDIKNVQDNGVKKVETSTGYTFDKDGLKTNKSDAETSITIDEAALKVLSNFGSTDEDLLYVGYVKNDNKNYRNYVGETIVAAANIIAKKYLSIPNSRFEDYDNPEITGGHGTGVFDDFYGI